MAARKRYPANAPGPFYVEDGCCTMCGVPDSAPEVFGNDRTHCYVQRQPVTEEEVERTLRVIRTQEFDCVRYGGEDDRIRGRLAEAGEADKCDVPVPEGVRPVRRAVVVFGADAAPEELLARFESWLGGVRYRYVPIEHASGRARFAVSWFEDHFHEVVVRRVSGRYVLRHSGPVALSELIDDWLRASAAAEVAWYSEDEIREGSPGRDRPW